MTVSFHVRSSSYPSRQHPQAAHVDEQLTRLRSSETASSSSIRQRLSNLQDLHDSLEKMIRLSVTNHALSQDQIEKFLDGSIKILDLCNVAKDALSQMKEGLMEIQSILRRKRGDLSAEVKKYLASRKFLKKSFQKACGKWPLVSKMMSQSKVTCEADANEFTRVDMEFQSEKSLQMEDVQNLESCIQDLEDGIGSLSKSLIKYRVSILNI
ncbi:carrier [Arabidopsis lyrata subsp. lyrata]|uniref:Carrier n=1 Tax=Arabidopsis lyrata subsp. lyrata TaxID=81972 RepID=D7MD30_ARALL|nr:carrier [Arabidopsis lyrata subsp. lyrata]